MKVKSQLATIIIILLSEVILSCLDMLGIEELAQFGSDIFYVTFRFIDILVVLYLFYFVTIIKQQKLSYLPFGLILLTTIFSLFDHFLQFGEIDIEFVTQQEYFLNMALIKGIPSLVFLISTLVIALQLIKNDALPNQSQNYIALVGKSYIIMIATSFTVPIISFFVERIDWEEPLYLFFYSLPIFLMINLYWYEFQLIKKQMSNTPIVR